MLAMCVALGSGATAFATEDIGTQITDPDRTIVPDEEKEYSGTAGENLVYCFEKGTLLISGEGEEIFDFTEDNPAPWLSFAEEITEVDLKNAANLKKIGSYAFCNLTNMSKIVLPDTLAEVGERAFFNCYVLQSIVLNKSVKTVAKGAFENSGLKNIKFMNKSTVIEGSQETIPPTTIVQGFENSTAYKYAKKNYRTFFMLISSIAFEGKQEVVTKGDKYNISYSLSPSVPSKPGLKWYTTDKKVAVVNSKGVVTAKKQGVAFVYAQAADGSGAKSSKFKIIVTNFKLNKFIFTNNNCYKEHTAIDPKGIMVHSTGANTPYLRSYIPNWNISKPGGREVCVHGFVGIDTNGKIATYQTLPFQVAAWGCGGGRKGSFNYDPGYIQFECCEDNLRNKTHFKKIYEEATDFCAYLCLKYCLSYKQVTSHAEANRNGYASAHGDIDHWLKIYGLTIEDLRKTVKKKIYAIDPDPDLTSGSKRAQLTVKKDTVLWSRDFADYYGTGSKKLFNIKKGEKVKFIRDDFGGWSKVVYKGKKGYIRNPHIELPYKSVNDKLKISKYNVKYYSKPTTMAKYRKGTFKYGTKVTVISTIKKGSKKGWKFIQYNGKEYYIKIA